MESITPNRGRCQAGNHLNSTDFGNSALPSVEPGVETSSGVNSCPVDELKLLEQQEVELFFLIDNHSRSACRDRKVLVFADEITVKIYSKFKRNGRIRELLKGGENYHKRKQFIKKCVRRALARLIQKKRISIYFESELDSNSNGFTLDSRNQSRTWLGSQKVVEAKDAIQVLKAITKEIFKQAQKYVPVLRVYKRIFKDPKLSESKACKGIINQSTFRNRRAKVLQHPKARRLELVLFGSKKVSARFQP